jgi:hypothetical protein
VTARCVRRLHRIAEKEKLARRQARTQRDVVSAKIRTLRRRIRRLRALISEDKNAAENQLKVEQLEKLLKTYRSKRVRTRSPARVPLP